MDKGKTKSRSSRKKTKTDPTIVAAIIGLIGTLIAAVFASPALITWIQKGSAPPPTSTSIPTIAIDAQKSWQPTGVEFKTGDAISVQVVGGKWSGWRDTATGEFEWVENAGTGFATYIECGSEKGAGYVGKCPVKQANITSLVGRIGSTVYSIGTECIFQAGASGILELSINDDYLEDNVGILAVQVAKVELQNLSSDSNCGLRSQ